MSKNQSIVYFDNNSVKEKTINNLNSIPEFLDKKFLLKKTQKFLLKKLGLLENEYWNKFRTDILKHMKANSYVVIKDLPFDDNNRLVVGLSCFIGTPLSQFNKKILKMVHEITPRTGPEYDENFPHTDGVYWPEPNDVIALQCVRKDQNNGGLSRIVPINSAIEKLKSEGNVDVIKKLTKSKFPFTLDPRYGKSGMHLQHILTREKFSDSFYDYVRFLRADIEYCIKEFHVNLEKTTIDAVKTFENELIKIGKKMEFQVKEGDWLLVDNKRALHSRSPTSPNSTRTLRRIKFNLDRKKVFVN